MSVAGTYAITTKTPMGDQKGTFVVTDGGDGSFSGTVSSDMMGSMDTEAGTISGNTLAWKMSMKVPMPMDLDCSATVDGDAISGDIKTGMFGTMTFAGTRA